MSIVREYAGLRYGIAFLISDSRLSEEDKDYLFRKVGMLEFSNKTSAKLKTDTLEGRIFLSKPFAMIGGFAGKQYNVEADSDKYKKLSLKFIVSELTPGTHSKN